ncbi:MAG TPA: ABC transporter substrate-binding protein [Ignavibacteriaceae bacterium]
MTEIRINTFIISLIIILALVSLNTVFSQGVSEEEMEKSFDSALTLYNNGNIEESLAGFNKFLNDYNYNAKTTTTEFFIAKIQLQLKQLNQFKFTADQFLELYPNSNYVDEVRLLQTKYYLEIANYYNAFKEILSIIEKTNSSLYEQKAKKIGEGIAAKYLNETQLQKFYSSSTSIKVKPYVLLQQGKNLLRIGDSNNAENVFEELINGYPNSDEYDEAKKLMNHSYSPVSANTIIGVMLPLETNFKGEYTAQSAIEILEGIKFAVNEFNKDRVDKVGLLIRDTKKDADEIANIRDEFVSMNSIVAILGPIFSNEVRSTLQEFDDYDIPIISPTATDDDLTGVSHNFFQANPSFSVRGRIMAQYLFYLENRRSMSVMNSIEGYSPILASSFISEFEELGGKVLKREAFKNDFTDFSSPVSKIFSDSLVIQGIYIPLSDNSVTPFIFSEFIKYGIKIPLYGNQDWFTAKGFETASAVSNNLTFTSDYFVDYNSEAFKSFSDQFGAVTGKDVNRNVLYGYDVAKYLLTAIRNSEPGRKNLVDKMISGMVSSGLHNNISFDARRINKFLNIVRYNAGLFELVDKFRLGQ